MPYAEAARFLALQDGANQNLNFWLVIAGILIIFFCMLAVFVPNIKNVITKPQEFSGLGVSMRVSILTVFVLMGVVLSMSSFVLQWQNYLKLLEEDRKRLDAANNEIAALKAKLEEQGEREVRARKFDTSILLKPQGFSGELLSDEWECTYRLDEAGTPTDEHQASLDSVRGRKILKAELKGISADTRIYRLTLRRMNKVWAYENFSPLRDGIFEPELEGEDSK